MKKILLFTLISSFCHAQILVSKFVENNTSNDFPKVFQERLKHPKIEKSEILKLQTQLDSIDIYITKAYITNRKPQFIYWIYENKKIINSEILKANDNSNSFTAFNLKLKRDRPSLVFPVSLKFNPNLSQVAYYWSHQKSKSNKAELTKLNHVIDLGSKFENIELKDLEGEKIDLKDDTIFVINIWATSCSPCREEIPELNQLVEKYKNHQNLEFIAISDESPKRIKKFLLKKKFNYSQAIMSTKKLSKITKLYPLHMIVNKNRIVDFYYPGYSPESSKILEQEIQKQLIQ